MRKETIKQTFEEWNDWKLNTNRIERSSHLRNIQCFNRHYNSFGNKELYLEPGAYKKDIGDNINWSDRTGNLAAKRLELERKMKLVEQTAFKVDSELAEWLLRAVTDGLSYESLLYGYSIPCCRETFYERYRRYFKALSESQK